MQCTIYDFETLGLDTTNCPILSLALFSFDTAKQYTLDSILPEVKFFKFSVADQVENYNRQINKNTLDWWKSQPKELQDSQLKPSKNDLPLSALYDIMKDNIGEKDIVFTRGNTFDPMITTSMMKVLGKPEPYPWWNVRDTRSFLEGLSYGSDLKNNFIPPELEGIKLDLHDPRTDIAIDVLRIQTLVRAIS
jgi:hypothetical protein